MSRFSAAALAILVLASGTTGCYRSPAALRADYDKIAMGCTEADLTKLFGKGTPTESDDGRVPAGVAATRFLKWTGDDGSEIVVGLNDGAVKFKSLQLFDNAASISISVLTAPNQVLKGSYFKEVEGPPIDVASVLQPGLKPEKVEGLLGPPTTRRKISNFDPPFTLMEYRNWGLSLQFHGNHGLCRITITHRWTTDVLGVRIGDSLLDAHRVQPLIGVDGAAPPPTSTTPDAEGSFGHVFRIKKYSHARKGIPGSDDAKKGKTQPFYSGWKVGTNIEEPWSIREIEFYDPDKYGEWRSPGLLGL